MRELAVIGFNTRQLATHECTENGITYFSLSIGDLIGMLPVCRKTEEYPIDSMLSILPVHRTNEWRIAYDFPYLEETFALELIDALLIRQ